MKIIGISVVRDTSIPRMGKRSRRKNGAGVTLGEFIQRVRRDKELSLADVERRSKRMGSPISRAYLNQLENGHYQNPTPEKIDALALALDIPASELFAVALGMKSTPDPEKNPLAALSLKFDLLPEDKRGAINFTALIDLLDREIDIVLNE